MQVRATTDKSDKKPSSPNEEIVASNEQYTQWEVRIGVYVPILKTVAVMNPGVYAIQNSPGMGWNFLPVPIKDEGLLIFPQTNAETIINEIDKFWDQEQLFRDYDIAFKRGILLYGPQGSGKSSITQLATRRVVERGGVVFVFRDPHSFLAGMRIYRQIHPDRPVVCLMEDLDAIMDNMSISETEILNVLDGINLIDNVIFIATTNHPERLGERIKDRPSRFDKRYYIGNPNKASRKIYLEYILNGKPHPAVNIDRWVADTRGFSLAHLKELFVNTVIFGNSYEKALETLQGMKKHTETGGKSGLGFRRDDGDASD